IVFLMKAVHREYTRIGEEILSDTPLEPNKLTPPIAIVPIKGWSRVTKKALRFAMELSPDVTAVQVEVAEGDCQDVQAGWERWVEQPARNIGRPAPRLEIICSAYRRVLSPLLDLVLKQARAHPDRQIAVVIPEIVQDRWYNYALHNQRAAALKAMLYFFGNRQIMVVNVPWYLRVEEHTSPRKWADASA
ncbi:MAG: APC family permease, partial [Acidobacteria bacterium]|nr:APC family permease [Acidobacteriota bacterium]